MARLTRRFHIPSAIRPSSLRIEAEVARGLIEDGGLLIDARRLDDKVPPLDGALRAPPDTIPEHVSSFPRDAPIVLACT